MTTQAQVHGMSAAQLAAKIVRHEPVFILDVRNENDVRDWSIEGNRVELLNIPYFELLDNVEAVLKQVPLDRAVIVVCAKEGSSIFVAEQLAAQGYRDVSYLIGGMKAWSEHLEPVKIADLKDGGALYQFIRIGKGCLSYMIISDGEAAVIDAVRMTDVFERFAAAHGAVITHAIDTHLHADHISGGRQLAEQAGALYWLPPKDAEEVVFPYEKLEGMSEIAVGRSQIRIEPFYSPGHTIGSTSLVVDNQYLLSGDILFVQSIGRPDLAGKADDWVSDLRTTLYERYKRLPQHLIVLPAHFGKAAELGEDGKVCARLGDLYAANPGLNIPDEAEFRMTVTEQLPPQPNSYQEIRQTNMGKLTPTLEQQRDMEIGPNRCAVHDA
ncbi:Hydroxyacylglutathione hydrolase [Paenibacillus solanacearum]|uniref:Hydroxyacylglutathione hydrolase n=1 Tax=Paenibacillus solanacearum TaxID=2048548 RepID=A0A916NNG6_9BACL|nr:MBL fold metallo-hydrolase [Paenibacillus solanacearum]CAG7607672.1 Hydroxyacylglutathione hydrolase [Paenibacillus solanacearum]